MPANHISPSLVVLSVFLVALIVPVFSRLGGKTMGFIFALVPAAGFCYFAMTAPAVWSGEIWRSRIPWSSELNVHWDMWISPLGLFLALLVTGIGTLIVIYAGGYMDSSPRRAQFFQFLFLFMGAMLGLSVSEHLIIFFVFWELTSIASFLLIGFTHSKLEARKSALDSLLVTGAGGLILLAGILLLGQVGGSYRLEELYENREAILSHSWYPAILLCILAGAFTKSAQFPFHFWLPGAMTAPAPVSAYLHSATMVKAGVFLLALIHPILGSTVLWHDILLGFGTVTMVWGAVVAAVQTDLKRLLAFSTVSALGTLVMLLGIESELAAKAAVIFFTVHALYKGALFMIAGILEKTTGIRNVDELNGLIRQLPVLGVAAVFAAASMSGLPPFIGFIAKELLYEVKLDTPFWGWSLLACGVVANAANIVVALKVGVAPFLAPRKEKALEILKKPSIPLILGPLVLAVASLLLGLFPQTLLGDFVTAMVKQIEVEEVKIKLKLWHGFNLVLLLSLITMLLGALAFAFRHRLAAFARFLGESTRAPAASAVFRRGLSSFLGFAGWLTSVFQSGNLRNYFITILLTFIGLLIWTTTKTSYDFGTFTGSAFRPDVALIVLLIAVSAVALALTRQRFSAILLLGCVGFGISALFALYGAPDLAITQLLVETLTLVLFALAVAGLPDLARLSSAKGTRIVSLVIAVAFGTGISLLTLKALDLEFQQPVSAEMVERSVPDAYGRNVVNVTLVDYRALDTMGEVVVLAIAALGVAAILGSACPPIRDVKFQRSAVLLASARYTAPAMIVISLYLLLRGHNDPGGGFIGGLVGAMSAILTHLANPGRELKFMRLTAPSLIALGIGLAVLSGLPGLFLESSFASALWGPGFHLPIIGKLKLGTPLLFDIGIYLVVIGIVLMLYDTMERWNVSNREQTND